MSGGSYNYLFAKEVSDLAQDSWDLREMADALERNWPKSKAARDTRVLVELLDAFTSVLEGKKKPLEGVWKAQEWWESNDYSKGQVAEEVLAYEHKA